MTADFASALAATLKLLDLSQAGLAEKVGRSPAAVSQWLHRVNVPSFATAHAMEKELGIAPGRLTQYLDPGARSPKVEETSPEAAFRGALLRLPLTDAERRAVLEIVERLLQLHAHIDGGGSGE